MDLYCTDGGGDWDWDSSVAFSVNGGGGGILVSGGGNSS